MAPASKTLPIPGTTLEYTLRRSPRSRRAKIRVTTHGKIEVVIPQADPRTDMTDFVLHHLDWIRKVQARYQALRQEVENETPSNPAQATDRPAPSAAFPTTIELRAIQQSWCIHYDPPIFSSLINPSLTNPSQPPAPRLTAAYPNLVLQGVTSPDRPAQLQAILNTWLRRQAQLQLPPWLRQLSQTTGLPYTKVTLRSQKTIWGSCSAKKTISLNDRLLFLPPNLVTYVLIHELCHTQHLNHSRHFWALVRTKSPNFEQDEANLNKAWAYIPSWAAVT
ncbi:MAG: M48 family metallopeptidase [Prochlorothrix sp.]